MPATLVFRASNAGTLQQVQVGPSDVVATIGAAQAAWGWLGGLEGVQRLLRTVRITMQRDPFSTLNLKAVKIPPAVCHMLTSQGLLFLQDEDTRSAFGGDPITQAIGFTICALEHECGGPVAVDMFVRFIANSYIGGPDSIPGLSECLQQQLLDHLPAIISEGASRGLGARFLSEAAELPRATRQWHFQPENLATQDGTIQNFELSLLGGLLLWLSSSSPHTYYTRSSLTARNAAYLKSIGYSIGSIIVWNGQGEPPEPKPSGVVLVTGGSMSTDHDHTNSTRVSAESAANFSGLKLYFRQDTVGSMLVNSLGVPSQVSSETAQEMFEFVRETIISNFSWSWEIKPPSARRNGPNSFPDDRDGLTLYSTLQHRQVGPRSTALCTRLASVYFPLSAELVSRCYTRIAMDEMLSSVQAEKLSELQYFEANQVELRHLTWFRIVTASIVLAIVECLATESFREISHVTQLYLGSADWLEPVTQRLDKTLRSGIPYYDAAIIIGTVHAATPTSLLGVETAQRSTFLGFRHGTYAVVPAVLAAMKATTAGVGITCFEKFIANIPTFPDGTIRGEDAAAPGWSPPDRTRRDTRWQELNEPRDDYPDMHLYIGIERAHLSTSPKIILCARVNGGVVGISSIKKVMWTITRSSRAIENCPGHSENAGASNVVILLKPSTWGILGQDSWEKFDSTLSKTHHIFLPVLENDPWTLCIAGSAYPNEQMAISYGCFDCAASLIKIPTQTSLICGYGSLDVSGEHVAAEVERSNVRRIPQMAYHGNAK